MIEHWQMLVFAHEQEMAYLTGQRHDPPADPSAAGGLLAREFDDIAVPANGKHVH